MKKVEGRKNGGEGQSKKIIKQIRIIKGGRDLREKREEEEEIRSKLHKIRVIRGLSKRVIKTF